MAFFTHIFTQWKCVSPYKNGRLNTFFRFLQFLYLFEDFAASLISIYANACV